jgi:hypothetical protein
VAADTSSRFGLASRARTGRRRRFTGAAGDQDRAPWARLARTASAATPARVISVNEECRGLDRVAVERRTCAAV